MVSYVVRSDEFGRGGRVFFLALVCDGATWPCVRSQVIANLHCVV